MDSFPQEINSDTWKRVVGMREDDISDFNNMPKVYVTRSPRTASPSSPTDITAADSQGDSFAADGFLYYLANINGNLRWQRAILSDWS